MKLTNILKNNLIRLGGRTLGTSLLLALIASCSDDAMTEPTPDQSETGSNGSNLFLSVNIAPLVNSRSQTGYAESMAKEDGQEFENVVNNAYVILAKPDDNTIIATYSFSPNDETLTGSTGNKYNAGKELTEEEVEVLKKYLGNENSKECDVYVICNYDNIIPPKTGENVQKTIKANTIDDAAAFGSMRRKTDQAQGTIEKFSFLMTNADYQNEDEDGLKDKYKMTITKSGIEGEYTYESPLAPDNAITVQRSVARVDIDNSNVYFYFDKNGNPCGMLSQNDQDKAIQIPWSTSVSLEFVGLVNLSNSFNLFKETGQMSEDGGKDEDNSGFFWSESPATGDNARFVIDPNYASKKSLTAASTTDFSAYFFNHWSNESFLKAQKNYDRNNIDADEVVGNNRTLIYGKNFHYYLGLGELGVTDKSNYSIFEYCLPNTIHEINNQKAGISTGLMFIARMNFKGGMGFGVNRESATHIYAWKGKIYGTNKSLLWLTEHPNTDPFDLEMVAAYKRALENVIYPDGDEGDKMRANDDKWKETANIQENTSTDFESNDYYQHLKTYPSKVLAKAMTDQGFAIYFPYNIRNGGAKEFYCYYIAWIRHNDNGNDAEMGPMEFGVVRNNIYKMKVTGISQFGHPMPGPEEGYPVDPDPITPDQPDETVKKYISVDCKVLDWRVKFDTDITLGR